MTALNAASTLLAMLFSLLLSQQSTDWSSGREFETAARRTTIGVNWQLAPLKAQLLALSRNQQVAVLIDRRIDPGQLMNRQISGISFEQLLWAIASEQGLGVAQVGDLFYLAPETSALAITEEVTRLAKQLSGSTIAGSLRKKLTENVRLSSNMPFEPGAWLREEAERSGIRLGNLESLPLDWWGPIDWPTLPRYQAYALLLAGFELELKLEGSEVVIGPAQLPEETTRAYELDSKTELILEQLRLTHPKLRLRLQSKTLVATGPTLEFNKLEREIANLRRPVQAGTGERQFTLKTNAPRGSILATVAQQLGVKLSFPEELRETLNERVQIDVQKVGVDELLSHTLSGTELTHSIQSGELQIRKK